MTAFYEFRGTPFAPRLTGDTVPAMGPPLPVFSERHVPYSQVNILDMGGFGARRWAANIRLVPENVDTMMNKLMSTGDLIVQGETWANATLVKLDNHQVTPRARSGVTAPDWEPDYHFFDAEWVIGGTKLG
jgi:hypothetical protein